MPCQSSLQMDNYILAYYQKINDGSIIVGKWISLLYEKIVAGIEDGTYIFRSVFIPIPKKGNAKECTNYCIIALISHASKVMLKIHQARLQEYLNHGVISACRVM